MIELQGRISSVQKLKGGVNAAPGKLASEVETYLLVTEDGQEIPAVTVAEEVVFTATANDIRAGTVAATSQGVTEGTKEIPAYHTTEGIAFIPADSDFEIYIATAERYNFTKLQAILCPYNNTIAESVAAEGVVIEKTVYAVSSATAMASVTVDPATKKIKFGIKNTFGVPCIIRYFTYKEEN